MIEILSGTKFKCAFCRGTGIQPRSLHSRCIACRGKGEVKFEGPVIECPTCRGSGMGARSSILSCIRCRGVGAVPRSELRSTTGVVEKDEKASEGAADSIPSPSASYGAGIIGERLGEITKRLRWTRKETEKKIKEIEKKLEPIKKEGICLKELGNKVKKAWVSLWED